MTHEKNLDIERRIRRAVATGLSLATIAKRQNMRVEDLERKYKQIILRAAPEMRALVGARLFEAARKGNIPVIIFWLKTRARWQETIRREVVEMPAENVSPVLFILGCNRRCGYTILDRDERRKAYEEVLGFKLPLPDAPVYPEFPTKRENAEIYQLLVDHCVRIAEDRIRRERRLHWEMR